MLSYRVAPGDHVVNKSKDKNENEINISLENTECLFLHPVPFECDIRPRDYKAVELLKSLILEHEGP